MPELPDIAGYITALEPRIVGETLERVRIATPFLLRTVEPPVTQVEGTTVREIRRIGKRIAFGMENNFWLVLHLMIAGRLHWRPRGAKLTGRQYLAAFDFPTGFRKGQRAVRKPVANAEHRYTSSAAKRPCGLWIPEESTS